MQVSVGRVYSDSADRAVQSARYLVESVRAGSVLVVTLWHRKANGVRAMTTWPKDAFERWAKVDVTEERKEG